MSSENNASGAVWRNRKWFELGHQTSAAPDAFRRSPPSRPGPTACTASKAPIEQPCARNRVDVARGVLVDAFGQMQRVRRARRAAGTELRRHAATESSLATRSTRSGKSRASS